MKLDSYLRERGLTSAQFAKNAGLVGKQVVHNYRHGLRFPTAENLRRIREATKGEVTAEDFVDQHAGSSPALSALRAPTKRPPNGFAAGTPSAPGATHSSKAESDRARKGAIRA